MSDIQSVPVGVSISDPDHPLVVVIGLVRTDDGEVVLKVEARGFEESDAGAVDLAEHLEAIAAGIRSRMERDEPEDRTAGQVERKTVRPRFNPQPRGKQGGK